MPYYIKYRNSKWVVVGTDGHVFGTHPSKKDARVQQKALYHAEGEKAKKK